MHAGEIKRYNIDLVVNFSLCSTINATYQAPDLLMDIPDILTPSWAPIPLYMEYL